MTVVI